MFQVANGAGRAHLLRGEPSVVEALPAAIRAGNDGATRYDAAACSFVDGVRGASIPPAE
ncbi:MAG: hypothetical protein IV100_28565 [Myxococcales bacterium]|nr:hypothetical protein [Myxococcales bacterium]